MSEAAIKTAKPGDVFSQEVFADKDVPVLVVDNVLIQVAASGVELGLVRSYSVDMKLLLTCLSSDGTRAQLQLSGTESRPAAALVERLRLDPITALSLANGLRDHIRAHLPEIADQLQ